MSQTFQVIIEISPITGQVKYEYKNGLLQVDRFLSTPIFYPCNYGFIPNSLGGDGDPLDVLLKSSYPLLPGCQIEARPIGALVTEDEAGEDLKILALPLPKVDPALAQINHYQELPELFLQQIEYFFAHYKDLEKGKWVKVKNWIGPEEVFSVISDGLLKNLKN
jgi:inorganic pyrophosphatase